MNRAVILINRIVTAVHPDCLILAVLLFVLL